jgi:hypothetical protein
MLQRISAGEACALMGMHSDRFALASGLSLTLPHSNYRGITVRIDVEAVLA